MSNLFEIQGIGNLTKKPILQQTEKGWKLFLPTAVNYGSGEHQQTEYVTLVEYFTKEPKAFLDYLHKGTKVLFRGTPNFSTEMYEGKPQKRIYVNLNLLNLCSWEKK